MSSHQRTPTNNGLASLPKTILLHGNYFLSSVGKDGTDGNGLQLEKIRLNFSNSFSVLTLIDIKWSWFVSLNEIKFICSFKYSNTMLGNWIKLATDNFSTVLTKNLLNPRDYAPLNYHYFKTGLSGEDEKDVTPTSAAGNKQVSLSGKKTTNAAADKEEKREKEKRKEETQKQRSLFLLNKIPCCCQEWWQMKRKINTETIQVILFTIAWRF